jgi:hypothetical protein
MKLRTIANVWACLIFVGIVASLFYMVRQGLCDTTTCPSHWLRPFLLILAGVGIVATMLLYLSGRGRRGE